MTFIFLWIFFFNEVYGLDILKEEPVALSGAYGMALTSEGSLLLSDTFRSRGTGWSWVFESTSQGWVQRDVRGVGMAGLEKIEGGYLACDVQGSKVFELDEDLRKVREWSVPSPWNAKRSAEGRIFVVSFQNKVFELMDEGPPLTVISDLDAPFDLEFSQSPNELWISEQGVAEGRVSLWKIGETAERILVSDYPWDNPEGMVLKGESLWVLDTQKGELVEVSKEGEATLKKKGLGVPILIRSLGDQFIIYTNNFLNRGPHILTLGSELNSH